MKWDNPQNYLLKGRKEGPLVLSIYNVLNLLTYFSGYKPHIAMEMPIIFNSRAFHFGHTKGTYNIIGRFSIDIQHGNPYAQILKKGILIKSIKLF